MPWRKIAVGTVVAAIVLGAAAAVVVPAIDQGKEAGARRERAEHEAFLRHERARLAKDQRPVTGSTSARGRTAIVAALAGAITQEARARVRAGTLHGPIRTTHCQPAYSGRRDPRTGRAIYDCTAVSSNPRGSRGEQLSVGYDFIATVDLHRGRFCWCKLNTLPSEHEIRDIPHVAPSRRCAGPLRSVL